MTPPPTKDTVDFHRIRQTGGGVKPEGLKNFLCAAVLAASFLLPACVVAENTGGSSRVDHVSDGDTLILQSGEKVRLIGVDTPEIHDDDHRNLAHAQKYGQSPAVVDEFAQKARVFAQKMVLNKEVRLEYDWQRQDKFGRTLAYVYRKSDNLFLNAELVNQGYGFAYTRFPFKYKKEFRGYEEEARKNRRGLWG